MSSMNISKASVATRVSLDVAAGTSDIDTDILDMTGFESVVWHVSVGTLTAGQVTSLTVQHGDDSGLSDVANAATTGTAFADADDDKMAVVEYFRPTKRYVRLRIERATQNAVIDSVTATQYFAHKQPTTNGSTVISTALVTGS